MELLQLYYFRKVARLGHLTKAAEELHVAQPALSKTIARLEADLGVPLFDRKKRQIQLNEYGQIFLKQVEIALEAIEEGKRQISDQAELQNGRIVIASTDHQCDAELVSSFLQLFPEHRLLIKQTNSEHQNQKFLRDREIDFYITSLPVHESEFEAYPFIQEKIRLAVSKNHPMANRDSVNLLELTDQEFINLPLHNHFRQITDFFCENVGLHPQTICEVEEFNAISTFVEKEIGVAFLTDAVKNPNIVLIPIANAAFIRVFQIVWLKDRYLTKAAEQFQQFLLQFYQQK